MSMMGQNLRKGDVGETIASYPDYEQAQKAVTLLIDNEVPARDISIVGTGLRSVERVITKLGWARTALNGAITGLGFGILPVLLLLMTGATVQVGTMIGIILVVVAFVMAFSLINYSVIRKRRDFASTMGVVADHYDVAVAPTSINKSRELLGKGKSPSSRPVDLSQPPRYGERLPQYSTPAPPEQQTP